VKILCISDQIDPLVYSSSIKDRFGDVDLVLGAGDLPLDYLDFIVSSLNRPLLFVFGNHDLKDFHYYYKNNKNPAFFPERDITPGAGATHIGSQVKREGALILAGLGGSMRYNRGENQFTESGMGWEVFKLIPRLVINRLFRGRWLDILLTHAAPLGVHDKEDPCHRGFKVFLWFMQTFKPKYLIHGHIHLYDLSAVRTTKYQDTWVINAYSHYIIDTEEAVT
jgi:Icc-related predicted phosphoesterase